MHEARYNFLDKILHHVALRFPSIAEFTFDIDQNINKKKIKAARYQKHVFIAGLARAGTTILMQQFYGTNKYRSLTYRDMPFVLAPNLWNKISTKSQKDNKVHERLHGDGMMVGYDSPEALEEVFWRVFTGSDYIKKEHLINYQIHHEIIEKFRQYVAAILASSNDSTPLYLSKNNNNILRLPTLRKAFPSALILVPFREPLSHANSLLTQHKKFIELHKQDKFIRSYMNWLVHHEFGTDHRSFSFDGKHMEQSSTLELNYWLDLWHLTYSAIEKKLPENAHFVCYEDLCNNQGIWQQISKMAELPQQDGKKQNFVLSSQTIDATFDSDKLNRAKQLYDDLRGKLTT